MIVGHLRQHAPCKGLALVDKDLSALGRLQLRRVESVPATPGRRLWGGQAVKAIVRELVLGDDALPVLPHEHEREDLKREHNGWLHQVVCGGVPKRDDARV